MQHSTPPSPFQILILRNVMQTPTAVSVPDEATTGLDATRTSHRIRRRSSRFDSDDDEDPESGVASSSNNVLVDSDDDGEERDEEENDDDVNDGQLEPSLSATPRADSKSDSRTLHQKLTNPLIEELNLTTSHDLLRLANGVGFHEPDTFPLAYYARLLGLDHVIDESLSQGEDEPGIVSIQQLLNRLENSSSRRVENSVELPLVPSNPRLHWKTVEGEEDDIKLLDSCEFDPTYSSLLRGKAETTPVSIPQHMEVLKIPAAKEIGSQGCSPALPVNALGVLQQVTETFHQYATELELYTISPLETFNKDMSSERNPIGNISTGWVASTPNDEEYHLTFHLEWLQTESQPCLILRITELPAASMLLRLFLMSLVVEQKVCAYGILPEAAADLAPYFRMTSVDGNWLCDFRKCSPRSALLRFEEHASVDDSADVSGRRRWIMSVGDETLDAKEVLPDIQNFHDQEEISLQYDIATLKFGGGRDVAHGGPAHLPNTEVLKHFDLPGITADGETNPLVVEIEKKQRDLATLEKTIDPTVRSLLCNVLRERRDNDLAVAKRQEECEIEQQCRDLLAKYEARQKEYVMQEVEAVCDICGDGEVEPDNSILFCEACNVAVHQFCYGVEEIPKGDYYCLPCRTLGRSRPPPGVDPEPLPIVCELCPIRDGAFVRTNMPGKEEKWVHVVCAKWHGLEYTDDELDCVEDCTEVKHHFRRMGVKCELCLGERGAMVPCSNATCKKHFHVTCARAIGRMKVIHGEDCAGPIEGGWRLSCGVHSGRVVTKPTKRKQKSIHQLIEAARQFPPEPLPPPLRKPFNQTTGSERRALLALSDYEKSLTTEFLTKRFYGVPCEICDVIDEGIGYVRCIVCHASFCFTCRINADKINKQFFKCHGCAFATSQSEDRSEGNPQCIACNEMGGILRPAFADPIVKRHYWKKFPKEKAKSLFGRRLWIHTVCNLYVQALYHVFL